MGYRSDVVFAIYQKDYFASSVLENVFPNLLKNSKVFKKNLGEFEYETNSKIVFFTCSGLKWYDSYPEIQQIQTFMDHLDEQDILYAFVRLGEHDDDIEKRGEPFEFDIQVNVSLDLPPNIMRDLY